MATHGLIGRIRIHKFGVIMSLFAQEVDARPLVRHAFVHRDNRIEQDGEVGTYFEGRERRNDRSQMAASRESHNTHVTRINAPHGSRVTYRSEPVLNVTNGFCAVALRQTVVHHEIGNALLVQPVGSHHSLMTVRQDGIATSRHTDNGFARGVLGQETYHFCLSVVRQRQRKLSCCLGLHTCYTSEQCQQYQIKYSFHSQSINS